MAGKKAGKAKAKATRVANLAPKAQVKGGDGKLMGEVLGNVSKTRSEISMTFARNVRA